MDDPPDGESLDPVQFLSGTDRRLRILDLLADGALGRDRLGERLDIPRTTLRRNLDELAQRGWLDHDPTTGTYTLTAAGHRAREAMNAAVDGLGLATDVGAFLRAFPRALPLSNADLDDLTVSVVTDRDPHQPVTWVRSHLDTSSHLRGYVPVMNPVYVSAVADLVDGGLRLDGVGSESAVETLRSEYPEEVAQFRDADSVSLSVATSAPEYAIAIFEDYTFVAAYDERMYPAAVVRAPSDHPLAEWAGDRFAEFTASATPLAEWL